MGLTLHCRASADRHRLHCLSVSRIIFYPFDDKMTSVEVTADEVSRGREEKDHIPPLASFFYLYRTVCVPQVKSFDRESFQFVNNVSSYEAGRAVAAEIRRRFLYRVITYYLCTTKGG